MTIRLKVEISTEKSYFLSWQGRSQSNHPPHSLPIK